MKSLNLFVFTLLFFLSYSICAQTNTVTLIAPVLELEEGQTSVDLDIRVQSFTNVAGIQFSLNWDPAVLDFDKVVAFGLSDLYPENFGSNMARDSGYLTFYWVDQAADGETVNDNHSIFSVRMNVVGNLHTFTPISFSDIPTPIEIVDPDYNEFDYILENGNISIGSPTNTIDLINGLDNQATITPNPFKEMTNVEFSLPSGGDVDMTIINQEGKKVFNQNMTLNTGQHSIPIFEKSLQGGGVYFVKIETEAFNEIQKLILLK